MLRRSSILILVAACATLAACGSSESGGDGDRAAGGGAEGDVNAPIRVLIEGEAEERAGFEAIVNAYQQANPGRTVTLDAVPESDILTKLSSQFAAGNPPDAFLINYRTFSRFAAEDAIAPVPEGTDLSGYYEQALAGLRYDGRQQCLPNNASSPVVYVNTDKLSAPGAWTWDEFAAAAANVKVAIGPQLLNVLPFVYANGGKVVDDPARPTRLAFDDPKSAEALTFVTELLRRDGLPADELASGASGGDEGGEEEEAGGAREAFTRGEVGLYIDTRKAVAALRESSGVSFDVAPIPTPPGGAPASVLYSDGYCVSAKSTHQAAARAFVAFAAGDQGAQLNAVAGRSVPPLRALAESPVFLDPTRPPAHAKVFLDAIPTLRTVPLVPAWAEVEERGNEALRELFADPDRPVDEAIRELDTESESVFAEGGSAAPGGDEVREREEREREEQRGETDTDTG